MQSVSSRIWTRITVSIAYDDNHYTTGTVIGVGSLSFLGDNHLEVAGSILTAGE